MNVKIDVCATFCALLMLLASAGCSEKLPEEPPHTVVNAYADAFNKKDVEAVLSVYSSAALAEADSAVLGARNMEPPYKQALCNEMGIELDDLEVMSGREFFVALMKAAFRKTKKMTIEVLDTNISGIRANLKTKITVEFKEDAGRNEQEVLLPVTVEGDTWKLDSTGLTPGPGPKPGK